MVNNSINIIKTKESLNIKTKESLNIKTKESLNSGGQQFHQYHQNKRKFKHQNKRKFKKWWSPIPSISSKQKKVYTVMVNNSINIIKTKESSNIKTKESFNSGGQQFHKYHQNKRKFKQWWSTIPQISSKQKKV